MGRWSLGIAACFAVAWLAGIAGDLPACRAQQQTNGGTTGTQGTQGTQGGDFGGISVDAEGVVRVLSSRGISSRVARRRAEAAPDITLPQDLNRFSELRKVSLVRLEQACKKLLDENQSLTDEMQFLAGLQRIDYVFVYPEQNDIVIAGPAEGFARDATGRPIGLTTGRPPMRLEDLVVALRTLERSGDLGCSIDPRQENLAALQRWLAQNSFAASSSVAKARYSQMAKILGMHDVRIWGVPAESHYAAVLVEADYRMKLISLGLERPGVRGLRSNLSMIQPGGNAMQRWWFIPFYDTFERSEDGLAFHFAGQRAQLVSQDEQLSMGGYRSDAPVTRVSTQAYAKLFTEKFPELADRSPVFAELQSLIDLAVMAALLKKERFAERVGWEKRLFLDEQRFPMVRRNVPRQVEAVANYKSVGGKLIIGLVGGGIAVNPLRTAISLEMQTDREGKVAAVRSEALSAERPEEHPWWWD